MSESEKQVISIILEHIAVCDERFSSIKKSDDFIISSDGNLILDAIAMRLLTIGENIKRINSLLPALQQKYPAINWDDIVRFRDFISHHYELFDYEIVYNICSVHLPLLKTSLEKESGV